MTCTRRPDYFLRFVPCPSPKLDRQKDIDFSTAWREQSADMSAFLLGWFRLIWLFTRGHQALVLENLALRQQLAVCKRHSKRPRLRCSDRLFWIVLAGLWKGWRRALVQVHPDTSGKRTPEGRSLIVDV